MARATQLNDKWIKASVLGTLWASSEIVLGSFLHNLRVPFSGNILTAIALVLLISASYKWREKGLFWRAGIICALLKTMSPSAVIFGPMVAIISEAMLLEAAVRLFGHSMFGFIFGSVLAMSWNLFQKIFNLIIFYGYNIVEVYTNLMKYAERQLHLQFDAVWAPLIIVLVLYAVFGVLAAIIGIRAGHDIVNNPDNFKRLKYNTRTGGDSKNRSSNFKYSLIWLVVDAIFIIGGLLLVGRIPFGVWVSIILVVATVWAFRYKRALRQLVRPRLWIFFVVITMLAAFIFTRLQNNSTTTFDAVLIGVEMNLRAILLIMGFTVLGTELFHPKIRAFFSNSYFRQLPMALELSLESLPQMVANTPDLKTILKDPVMVVGQLMFIAESHLDEMRRKGKYKTLVVTGGIGAGKTTLVRAIAENMGYGHLKVSGFYCPRILKNGQVIGYDLVDVVSNERVPFLRITGENDEERIGRFFISPQGLKFGNDILSNSIHSDLIIIDEVGRLELAENGWFNALDRIVSNQHSHLLLSIRENFVGDLLQRLDLSVEKIFYVADDRLPEEVIREILREIGKGEAEKV
jgi:nucleoside-triphosphatase THEP1